MQNLIEFYIDTNDGVEQGGEEGTFNICSFWMAEALTRMGRHHPELMNEARLLFEDVLTYTNHLGLYAGIFWTSVSRKIRCLSWVNADVLDCLCRGNSKEWQTIGQLSSSFQSPCFDICRLQLE
jgi:GH15 family glucan-1,4-alpha-glucosidase